MIESRGEVDYAMGFFELYQEEAKRIEGVTMSSPLKGRRMWTIQQPIGPAALITPWNFPLAMVARKVAPALAAGCSAVLKPSEETPLTALAMCRIFQDAGLPPGVVNCITADRSNASIVGATIAQSPVVRKLSFTGSTTVGKLLMEQSSSTVKKLSLELGGNAPFIVFEDADIQVAVKALMTSKFRNAGQACIAPNRVLVQEAVLPAFLQELTEKMKLLQVGDGLDPNVTIGPLINKKGIYNFDIYSKIAIIVYVLRYAESGRPYSRCIGFGSYLRTWGFANR